MVKCNSCGRKFSEKAAQKHVPFCNNKTKLDQIKQGGKKQPTPTSNANGRRK